MAYVAIPRAVSNHERAIPRSACLSIVVLSAVEQERDVSGTRARCRKWNEKSMSAVESDDLLDRRRAFVSAHLQTYLRRVRLPINFNESKIWRLIK